MNVGDVEVANDVEIGDVVVWLLVKGLIDKKREDGREEERTDIKEEHQGRTSTREERRER